MARVDTRYLCIHRLGTEQNERMDEQVRRLSVANLYRTIFSRETAMRKRIEVVSIQSRTGYNIGFIDLVMQHAFGNKQSSATKLGSHFGLVASDGFRSLPCPVG